jgi:tetratricopeptide (TPR) repeat protein
MKNRVYQSKISPLFQLFSTLIFCVSIAAHPTHSFAKKLLPPVSPLEQTTIDCLNNRDWECALQELIPLYYEQGPDSNLHYYIAYAYRQLAQVEIDQKKLHTAVDYLNDALEFVDADATLFADIGQLYFQLSQYDQAQQAFLHALSLNENNPSYLEVLGQLSYLTGEVSEASSYWNQALELEPDNLPLRQRLQQLQQQEITEHQGTTELSHTFRITFDEGMDKQIYTAVWEMLEDAWYDLGVQLDLYPKRQIPVLLLTGERFSSLTDAPSWAGGVYEGQIKIPVAHFDADTLREVIAHEYLHALIYDTMANRCPWWLNEGLAQYFSMEDTKKNALLDTARSLIQHNQTINLKLLPGDISQPEQARAAYTLVLSATEFLIQRFSISSVRAILFTMGQGMSFAESLQQNTGYSLEEFSSLWRSSL